MIDFNSTDKNALILESRGLCKYFDDLKVVENVDMKIMVGDTFGIIGLSSAGRATFFSICTGTYTSAKGKVYLTGEDVTGFSFEKVARGRMAKTFQDLQPLKFMSAFDNVKIGCHVKTESSMPDAIIHTRVHKQDEEYAISKNEGILKTIDLFGYRNTMVGNLAYGVQRRMEIARALALGPYILLPDEPAVGMSPLETRELVEFIKMLNEGDYTIAVTERDMKFAMDSRNHILVLNFDQRICEGMPDGMKASHQIQEAYLGKGIVAGEAVKVHA